MEHFTNIFSKECVLIVTWWWAEKEETLSYEQIEEIGATNGDFLFYVPKDWLEKTFQSKADEIWWNSYDHDDGYNIYKRAKEEKVIVAEFNQKNNKGEKSMEQKQLHLKGVNDVAKAFDIGVHEINKILINDGFRHAYELKDGRILTGEHYDNGMNSHTYTGGTVALYKDREEFNQHNPFGVKLTIGNEEFDLLEEMERIEKQRNELLDKIVERVNKREGQHLYEIIREVQSLCSQLEGTMVN